MERIKKMIKITLPEKVFGMDEFIENFFEDSDSGTCLGRGTINKNGYNLCDSCLCEKDIEGHLVISREIKYL